MPRFLIIKTDKRNRANITPCQPYRQEIYTGQILPFKKLWGVKFIESETTATAWYRVGILEGFLIFGYYFYKLIV